MADTETVNLAEDPKIARSRLLGLLLPVFGVLLVIAVIAMVSWHNYEITHRGAIGLSNDLLKAQQTYITEEVSSYLSPAISSGLVARDMLNTPSAKINGGAFMLLARAILQNTTQAESFYLANQNGSFWMIGRNGQNFLQTALDPTAAPGGIYTRELVQFDGVLISARREPAKGYDPRKRPWYRRAVQLAESAPPNASPRDLIYWSSPHFDPDTRQFVLTASTSFMAVGGTRMVFALNLSLNQLSRFINSLKVGQTGQAVIVDQRGKVIAGHNMAQIGQPGFDATNIFLNPKTQPVFIRALNVYRVQGSGTGLIRARDKNYITIAAGIPLAKRDWVLLLNAPEHEFASFAQVAQKQTILFSLVVVALAAGLALGFIWQGRRVRKGQKILREMNMRMERDSETLLSLSRLPGLLDPDRDMPGITEVLAVNSGAAAAGIWRYFSDPPHLVCDDLYDAARHLHGAGQTLMPKEAPDLFKALEEEHVIGLKNFSLPQAGGMRGGGEEKGGTGEAYFYPIASSRGILGAIMLENPDHPDCLQGVLALVAAIEAIRFARARQEKTAGEFVRVSPADGHQLKRLDGFLLNPCRQGEKTEIPPAGLYVQVPLLVLEFSGDFSINPNTARQNIAIIEGFASRIQDLAQENGIFGLQVSGSRVIFIGNCSQQPAAEDSLRLAHAALLIREQCLRVLSELSTEITFSMGMDVGPVLLAWLGHDPSIFNLWGQALACAKTLADGAPDEGVIQVSEEAYQLLRTNFLFRPRGEFYLPGAGVAGCYVLAGEV